VEDRPRGDALGGEHAGGDRGPGAALADRHDGPPLLLVRRQRLGQGRENAKAYLRDNPETAREIEQSLRQNAGLIAEKFLEDGGPEPDSDGDDAALG
jgi:hypothetical protein